MQATIEKDVFGISTDGVPVDRYTLRNGRGMRVRLMTYGATVTELWTPDRQGNSADLVLGFDHLSQYEERGPYFGCIVGRVAFRITRGQFTLDGKPCQLTLNDGHGHHLHGGAPGFSQVIWQAEPTARDGSPAVRFRYRSADGDQGYPGTLDTEVVYSLSDENELRIDCTATTDRPTLVNLSHHGYFNLAGAAAGDVLGHVVQIDADRWLPCEPPGIASGTVATVNGTPFDFRRPWVIGARIRPASEAADGYDLCYLHNHPGGELARVATCSDPVSGRVMEVLATEPAIVLYTGNYLDGTLPGKGGIGYPKHAGVCFETGRPPDAVHHPSFPSTILRPDQTYRHTCVYKFAAS